MRIQLGNIIMSGVEEQHLPHKNKTLRYLLPCMKEYGEEFTNRINNVFKIAVGVGDIVVKNRGIKYEKHLFILLYSKIAPFHFCDFIKWIRTQPMYEDDYVYANIKKSNHHMIVLKFPEKLYNSLEPFRKGKYSEMFDKETLNAFFKNYSVANKVVVKDRNYKVVFVGSLNRKFNLHGQHAIKAHEWTGELDLPPYLEGEYFNHHLIV